MSEVMQPVPTRAQKAWAVFFLVVAFIIVGGSAAWVSFGHIQGVALIGHQTPLMAFLYPLMIDGMMAICTVAIWFDSMHGRDPRWRAKVGFWVGLIVSGAANVAWYVEVWGWDWLGVLVSLWPPVGLLWSIEVVSKPGRPKRLAQAIARASEQIDRLRHHQQPATVTPVHAVDQGVMHPEPASSEAAPMTVNEASPASRAQVPVQQRASRDRGPAETPSPELVAFAVQVGREHYEQTGQIIQRDDLRKTIRLRGGPGFTHQKYPALVEAIREDLGLAIDEDDAQADEPDRAVTAAANGR